MGHVGKRDSSDSAVQNPNGDLMGNEHHLAFVHGIPCVLGDVEHPRGDVPIGLSPARPERVVQKLPDARVSGNARDVEFSPFEPVETLHQALIDIDRDARRFRHRCCRFDSALQRRGHNPRDIARCEKRCRAARHILAAIREAKAFQAAVENPIGVMNLAVSHEMEQVSRHVPILRERTRGRAGAGDRLSSHDLSHSYC